MAESPTAREVIEHAAQCWYADGMVNGREYGKLVDAIIAAIGAMTLDQVGALLRAAGYLVKPCRPGLIEAMDDVLVVAVDEDITRPLPPPIPLGDDP
jgi:hypothetical protein